MVPKMLFFLLGINKFMNLIETGVSHIPVTSNLPYLLPPPVPRRAPSCSTHPRPFLPQTSFPIPTTSLITTLQIPNPASLPPIPNPPSILPSPTTSSLDLSTSPSPLSYPLRIHRRKLVWFFSHIYVIITVFFM